MSDGAHSYPHPRVSAIVVTFDGSVNTVDACISSLAAQTLAPSELIVSDNSPDGRFADHFDGGDVSVLKNLRNLGFTGGTWAGAEIASGDLLFFVNPDARLDPNCLELLVSALATDPDSVIAGAQIMLPDGTVNSGELPVHFSGMSWCGNYRGAAEEGDAREAFAVSGCAYLVRAPTFRAFRGFRSRFEMYYDDTDLCWRTRLAGLKTMFVPNARVVHDHTEKEGYRWLWVERNRLLMVLTNTEARTLLMLIPVLVAFEICSWIMAIIGGWWKYKLQAYRQIVFGPVWLWRERREIRGYRTQADSSVIPYLTFELDTPGRPTPRFVRIVNGLFVRYGRWMMRTLAD